MKLIIGLGNPEKKYQNTWHNLGFVVVDELAKNGFDSFKEEKKFQAQVSDGIFAGEKILLVKPLTYMNNSGVAVNAVAHFYKVNPEDIIIIHDEFDLTIGTVRLSKNSSAAGHNGVSSIISHLGSQDFTRLRLGIRPEKPSSMPTETYVLKKIGLLAKVTMRQTIQKKALPALEMLLTKGLVEAQNKYHS